MSKTGDFSDTGPWTKVSVMLYVSYPVSMQSVVFVLCLAELFLFRRFTSLLAIFQPYYDLEAGDKAISEIVGSRPGIEPRISCSESKQLNQYTTAAPVFFALQSLYFGQKCTCTFETCFMANISFHYIPSSDEMV